MKRPPHNWIGWNLLIWGGLLFAAAVAPVISWILDKMD